MFAMDGIKWLYPCSITRDSDMTPSEISGLLLDGSYFNDVYGTYLTYTVRLEVPFGAETLYNALYEKITNPVSEHLFVFPYNGGTRQVVGRIEKIRDIYVRMKRNRIHWKGIEFTVISNQPSKYLDLDDVIHNKGIEPLPDSEVDVGAVYIYGLTGWEEVPDADNYYY